MHSESSPASPIMLETPGPKARHMSQQKPSDENSVTLIEEVLNHRKYSKRARKRAKALMLMMQGRSCEVIQRESGLGMEQQKHLLQRKKRGGVYAALFGCPHPIKSHRYDRNQVSKAIHELLQTPPPNGHTCWKIKVLAEHVRRMLPEAGNISHEQVRLILRSQLPIVSESEPPTSMETRKPLAALSPSISPPTPPSPATPFPATPSIEHGATSQVPLLSVNSARAITSPSMASQQTEERLTFATTDPDAFAIRISGDAMQPQHFEGDVVILYPRIPPRTGNRVVARLADTLEGDLLFRIYSTVDHGRTVILSCLNPLYPSLTLRQEEIAWVYPVAATVRCMLPVALQ
jgi:phage repressor protein C with HTH and peptisase S24 domain